MDIDKHPSIPGQLGIQSIPAVFAFVNGQPVDGFLGALPESQVLAFIERVTKDRIGGEEQDLLKTADEALAKGDAAGAADLYAQVLAQDSGNIAALAGLARSYVRPARSSRQSRRWRWCRRPSATIPRSRPRARRSRSPSRRNRSGRSPSWSRRSRPIRSIIRRASISRWRLNSKGQRQEAVDNLHRIVKRDRKWNDDGARKQLVQFFEAWGPTDEATVNGRKRLSSILFA